MINEDDVCGTSTAAAAAALPTRRLFVLQSVNSYGSTETNRLVDDGKPLDFDGKYISWQRYLAFSGKMTNFLFNLTPMIPRKLSTANHSIALNSELSWNASRPTHSVAACSHCSYRVQMMVD